MKFCNLYKLRDFLSTIISISYVYVINNNNIKRKKRR